MSGRRTRSMNGSEGLRASATQALALATQLKRDCAILLELHRKSDAFVEDELDGRMVSVPPASSQLDTKDKLWRLYSALLQCSDLLEKAIAKEKELVGEPDGEFVAQRKTVKDRLSFLLHSVKELLKTTDTATDLAPSSSGSEPDGLTSVFDLKLWIYRVLREVDHWVKMAVNALQELQSGTGKERMRTVRPRNRRGTRS